MYHFTAFPLPFLGTEILQYVSVHQLGPKLRPPPCKHTVHTRFTRQDNFLYTVLHYFLIHNSHFNTIGNSSERNQISTKGFTVVETSKRAHVMPQIRNGEEI